MSKRLTAIDLFAGCGGISAGLVAAGFDVLAGVDIDPKALRTFAENFGDHKAKQIDISNVEPNAFRRAIGLRRNELTLLAGGPPCQGFSKNVPRKNRFLDDPRNQLVRRFLEYAAAFRPEFILLENVAEMKNGFEQAYTNEILERMNDLKYNVEYRVLFAERFGVPQRRRRAFFLASRVGYPVFPVPTHAETDNLLGLPGYVSVWDAIGDLPSLRAGEGQDPCNYAVEAKSEFQRLVRGRAKKVHNHLARPLRSEQMRRMTALQPGQTIKDLPDDLRPKSGYSGAYGRLTKEMIAPTMTRWLFHPGSGRFGHPVDLRTITIREAARIQAFPDRFKFLGSFIQQSHQIGNAVPPRLVHTIARALIA